MAHSITDTVLFELGAFSISNLILLIALRKFAPLLGLLDRPSGRKQHLFDTPVVGGLTIFSTLFLAFTFYGDWDTKLGQICFWGSFIVLIGVLDDIINLRWQVRLFFQISITLCAVLSTQLTISYLGEYPIIGRLDIGNFSYAFTVLAVIMMINAFNFIDGIDGLCCSIALVPVATLLLLVITQTQSFDPYVALLAISLLIHCVFNIQNNEKLKIFLGDSGSTLVGFFVSFLLIIYSQNDAVITSPTLVPWLLIIPFGNIVFVTYIRVAQRRPIFHPSHDHMHDMLSATGLDQKFITLILTGFAVFCAVIGLALVHTNDAFMLGAICVALWIGSKLLGRLRK